MLVLAGPGNNGGDGLVAARHLQLLGFTVSVVYPKRPARAPFPSLVQQCELSGIPVASDMPPPESLRDAYDILVDALFGFSFHPPIRDPFVAVIESMRLSKLPIVSVDIPSGWDVEQGNLMGETGLRPDTLVSLTAPKKCAQHFEGTHHFLGGRFVPRAMERERILNLPSYPGLDSIVALEVRSHQ